jgi:hypothetical protein
MVDGTRLYRARTRLRMPDEANGCTPAPGVPRVEGEGSCMSEDVFGRRREHVLAELERPAPHRLRPAAVVLVAAVVLGVLAFAPVSGASLAHRVVTGIGDWWSSPAPPPKDPAEVQSFAQDVPDVPPGVTYRGGKPLPGLARDLLSGLGTAGDTITAFPTSTGAVCYMIQGAGTCANLDKRPWDTVGFTFSIFSTRNGGTRIFGIAADKVVSVGVEVLGSEQPAILENHALYYQLPAGVHESDIQRVTATWNDGSTHSVPFHRQWNPPHG